MTSILACEAVASERGPLDIKEVHVLQKNLDYVATPQSSRPPRVPGGDADTPQASTEQEPSIREIAITGVSWENPLLSGILTAIGIVVAGIGDYLLRGKHGLPLLSGKGIRSP